MTDDSDDPEIIEEYPLPAPDPKAVISGGGSTVDPEDPRPVGHYGRFRGNT